MTRRKRRLTVTSKGRKKRMPKTITLFGKRLPVFKAGWKFVQKVELEEMKSMGKKRKKAKGKKKGK